VLNPIPPSLFPSSGKIVTRKELFEESIHRTTSSEREVERETRTVIVLLLIIIRTFYHTE